MLDSRAAGWRDTLLNERRRLKSLIRAGGDQAGRAASNMYSDVYDSLLSAWFESCQAATLSTHPISLGAVGSYGRGMLSPNSDLDIRILCAGPYEASADLVQALVYPLWDAGLDVGHQVVGIDELLELAKTDLTTATALLDWRNIAGDRRLGESLIDRALKTLFTGSQLKDFVDRLQAYNRARHARFGDSVYLLEPNVKNGAGGLRDLDVAHWYARAGHHVNDLSELVGCGVLSPQEWTAIEAAREHLLRLRNALHVSVGRKTDRLTFDQQELLAERLGYGSGAYAVERFMSDYYRDARTIRRACEVLTPRLLPTRSIGSPYDTLEQGVVAEKGALGFADASQLTRDPSVALRLYVAAVERGLPVSGSSRQAITRVTASEEYCTALRLHPSSSELFRTLVCSVRETQLDNDSILGELHDVGLLLAMIPEFAPVVGRVHHDTYHVYTVDVHSIAAVDHLRRLVRGDLIKEHPLACRLAAEHVRRGVLFFSTLLHDVGKVLGGVGHAERGAKMAGDILTRLGMAKPEIHDVQLLIRLHLHMYQAATRRDIEDPETIRKVCRGIGSQELLRELFLLTVADVTTTSPTSMTHWKRDVMDELYTCAERYMSAQGEEDALPQVANVRDRIRALVVNEAAPVAKFLSKFLNGLPERYLFANDLQAVVSHAKFALLAEGDRSRVKLGAQRGQYCELWVVADDQPGLLSLIAASFLRARLIVHSAQVYTWSDDYTRKRSLDTFWVRHRSGREVTSEDVDAIGVMLAEVLDNGVDDEAVSVPPPSGRMGGAPLVQTEVNIDNRTATNHSVIEVITQDRPNLLFWLSVRLAELGLSIWFAKINTEGDRVADVFYVSDGPGGKIADPLRIQHIKSELLAVVERAGNALAA